MSSIGANLPTRIAVQVAPQHATMAETIAAVQALEAMGVDAVFNWDHFFPLSGDADGEHFECATQLAAWAATTSRVALGPLVFCNSYRSPDLLADMARTIDHISGGRFILGIGSGWFERDYDEYGYEFGTAGSRLNDLANSMPRILDRLARLHPAPIGPMPILIGGAGEQKTLKLVAQYADIWHSFVGPDELPHKTEVLRGHCERAGRDIADIEFSNGASVRDGVGGTGLDRLSRLHDQGVRLFTVPLSGDDTDRGFDLDAVPQFLAWRDARNA